MLVSVNRSIAERYEAIRNETKRSEQDRIGQDLIDVYVGEEVKII